MASAKFIPLTETHCEEVLRLNSDFEHWTAPMSETDLAFIMKSADYIRIARYDDKSDKLAGVLIGYAHDTDYPNHENLKWLREQLNDFFYIDRVIIDQAAQGQGLGRAFYEDLTHFVRDGGYKYLACEVNTRPDNPVSHKFHRRFGFKPLGEREFDAINKAVRYYALTL